MGYFNPISAYGVDAFLADAKAAGVDGLIVVDLPPEEDDELCIPAMQAGIHFVRLATPTTDDKRRSEEHTSEPQSLMRNSSAVLCLKKKITLLHTVTSHTKHD